VRKSLGFVVIVAEFILAGNPFPQFKLYRFENSYLIKETICLYL